MSSEIQDQTSSSELAKIFNQLFTQRSKFKDESNLNKLDDWVLVKGCRETGIISDIGYKHLDYIRDMRNHASTAHPNHNELTVRSVMVMEFHLEQNQYTII